MIIVGWALPEHRALAILRLLYGVWPNPDAWAPTLRSAFRTRSVGIGAPTAELVGVGLYDRIFVYFEELANGTLLRR